MKTHVQLRLAGCGLLLASFCAVVVWNSTNTPVSGKPSSSKQVSKPGFENISPIAPSGIDITQQSSSVHITPLSPPTSHAHETEGEKQSCAACIAEARLLPFREEFAAMRFNEIVKSFDLPESRHPELRDACADLASRVIREWSFSENRPLLTSDNDRKQIERALLEPIIGPRHEPAASDL